MEKKERKNENQEAVSACKEMSILGKHSVKRFWFFQESYGRDFHVRFFASSVATGDIGNDNRVCAPLVSLGQSHGPSYIAGPSSSNMVPATKYTCLVSLGRPHNSVSYMRTPNRDCFGFMIIHDFFFA